MSGSAQQVVLPVPEEVLQALRQRQEAHEDRRAEPQAAEAAADPQAAQVLQAAGVLLQAADLRPLLLLHQRRLQLGAQAHVVHVVQQDPDHAARQVLQPRDGDNLTELH